MVEELFHGLSAIKNISSLKLELRHLIEFRV